MFKVEVRLKTHLSDFPIFRLRLKSIENIISRIYIAALDGKLQAYGVMTSFSCTLSTKYFGAKNFGKNIFGDIFEISVPISVKLIIVR